MNRSTHESSPIMSPPAAPPLSPPPPPPPAPPHAPPHAPPPPYPARLTIDVPERLNRLTTAFRIILIIPIAVVLGIITNSDTSTVRNADGEWVTTTGVGITGALFLATLLMIVFRRRYPRWWFDFALELTRFGARVSAYFALVTDDYPSTVDEQSVHLDIDYPDDVERDLDRWLPLVKWFLAIPHYIVLCFLWIGALIAVIVAWFAILVTGRYPRVLFDYVVGVGRWSLRVHAYAFSPRHRSLPAVRAALINLRSDFSFGETRPWLECSAARVEPSGRSSCCRRSRCRRLRNIEVSAASWCSQPRRSPTGAASRSSCSKATRRTTRASGSSLHPITASRCRCRTGLRLPRPR